MDVTSKTDMLLTYEEFEAPDSQTGSISCLERKTESSLDDDDHSLIETPDSTTLNNNYLSLYQELFDPIEKIGRGGFGTIFKARHKLDKMNYAVKIINRNCFGEEKEFMQEAQVMAKLNHPNLVSYKFSWTEEASENNLKSSESEQSSTSDYCGNELFSMNLYIQMELCDQDLRKFLDIRNNKSLSSPIEEITSIGTQMLKALKYIHSQKIIHHDINPNNFLMTKINDHIRIKLGDFGLACLKPKHHNTPIGVALYASPEQSFQKQPCNEKSDIYSFGVVLLELLYPMKTRQELSINIQKIKNNELVPMQIFRELYNKYKGWADIWKTSMQVNPANRLPAQKLLQKLRFWIHRKKEKKLASVMNRLKNTLKKKNEIIDNLKRNQ